MHQSAPPIPAFGGKGGQNVLNFFDFEVFKHDWLVVIINPYERTTAKIANDQGALAEYYEKHKDEIWIGYNSRDYDQYILKAILCGFNPKEVNDHIILKKRKGWEYSSLLRNYPLNNFDIMPLGRSLKQLEGFMGHDIRETSVPFDIDRKLTPAEIEETFRYCAHDVEETVEVFLRRKVEFDAHLSLIRLFGMPLEFISKSQAQLAAGILCASRVQLDDEFDIEMPDTLQLGKYQYVADWFMDQSNRDYKKSLNTTIAGIPHVVAWGGVHGAVSKYQYSCGPDELLVMADVSQLYPCLMLEYRLLSRGCPESAYKILADTIATSIRLKEEGKKKEREPYKRFNNIIYGAEGDKTNPMYDPLHRNLVCIFGQVLIIDLIEKIEGFAQLIQSNTDGILVKIKRDDFNRLDDVVYEWERRTRLNMTFDVYQKVIQKDVNNYIVIDHKGKTKTKGAYVKGLSDLDYDLPIVNEAVVQYFTEGIPVERTINECQELKKFQKIVRVSGKYLCGWHNGERLQDKTFRVFASSNPSDGEIQKQKCQEANKEKFGNTPERCFIDNWDINDKPIPAKLDRQWYIRLAQKRVADFGGR